MLRPSQLADQMSYTNYHVLWIIINVSLFINNAKLLASFNRYELTLPAKKKKQNIYSVIRRPKLKRFLYPHQSMNDIQGHH